MLSKSKVLALTLIYTLALTVLSLISLDAKLTIDVTFGDKVFHLGAYAALVILLFCTLYKCDFRQALPAAAIAAIIYGIIIEVLQGELTVDREFDVFDIIANCIGVLISVVIIRVFNKSIVKYL
ncbi:MAG: VanZ family protein [Flavobacteriaceae bacterium]|nr:VanZ family protein [Flavobacteriaceae bacterium]